MLQSQPRFVIQRHQAKTLHYDFRLQKGGTLKSWAVPKGIPKETGVRRLAVQTDDHELKFADFEGTIPDREYGAGTIEIWDSGTYELHEWTDERIVFTLHGERLNGTFNLIRFRRGGNREWLLFKLRNKPQEAE